MPRPDRLSVGGNAIAGYETGGIDTDVVAMPNVPAIDGVNFMVVSLFWGNSSGTERTVNSLTRDGQPFTAVPNTLNSVNAAAIERVQEFILANPNISPTDDDVIATFSGNVNVVGFQVATYNNVTGYGGGAIEGINGVSPYNIPLNSVTTDALTVIIGAAGVTTTAGNVSPVSPAISIDEASIGGYIGGAGTIVFYERYCSASGQALGVDTSGNGHFSSGFVIYGSSGGTAAELEGNAVNVATAAGSLSASIKLIAAAINAATAAGSLNTNILFNSASVVVASATGELITSIRFGADALNVVNADGDLTTQISPAGDADSEAGASGDLTTSILLSGNAIDIADATASLNAGGTNLQGEAQSEANASGSLTTQISISAEALINALATAGLTADINLNAIAQNTVVATAELATQIKLSGDAAVVAAATASLAATASGFSADAQSVVIATADLASSIQLAGDAVGEASLTGEVGTEINLAAEASNVVTVTVDMVTQVNLTAGAIVEALATGELNTNIRLMGFAENVINAVGTLGNAPLFYPFWFAASAANQANFESSVQLETDCKGSASILTKMESEVRYAA